MSTNIVPMCPQPTDNAGATRTAGVSATAAASVLPPVQMAA